MTRRTLMLLCLLASSARAATAEKILANDGFCGGGKIFMNGYAAGEGAAVIIQGDPTDYPLSITAVEVVTPPMNASFAGTPGAFLVSIWKDDSPTPGQPGTALLSSAGAQFTATDSTINKYSVSPPITVASGKIWVGVIFQDAATATAMSIGQDSGPMISGVNYVYAPSLGGTGWFDAGTLGVTENFIIRVGTTVTGKGPGPGLLSITPNTGANNADVAVVVAGDHFQRQAVLKLGTNILLKNPIWLCNTSISASVPLGIAAGSYPLTLTNPDGLTATLPAAFTVSDAGGGGTDGGAGGTDGGGGGGTGSSGPPTVTSITPATGGVGAETPVVIQGTNFQVGAQALIGTLAMDRVGLASSTAINATVRKGMEPGSYDITVVNPDGQKATLPQAYTVDTKMGTPAGGCGCGSTEGLVGSLLSLLALVGLPAARILRRSRRRAYNRTP